MGVWGEGAKQMLEKVGGNQRNIQHIRYNTKQGEGPIKEATRAQAQKQRYRACCFLSTNSRNLNFSLISSALGINVKHLMTTLCACEYTQPFIHPIPQTYVEHLLCSQELLTTLTMPKKIGHPRPLTGGQRPVKADWQTKNFKICQCGKEHLGEYWISSQVGEHLRQISKHTQEFTREE